MALQAIPHYRAEQFPFAVTADAAEMVFEEMTANGSEVTKPVNFATQIAQEIDYTYDDTSMRQWWSFTTAAQEMAWLDFDKNKILGTAIYTSEDPYVRSTAYLVAEALNMEPAPLQDLGNYNPFTDQEVNERLHIRACDESFQTLMSQLVIDFNEHSLEDLIRRQNDRLMEGYPVGWCAHGLRLAFDAYQTAGASGERPADRALQAFVRGRDEVSWESLRSICRLVMHKRREEQKITPQMMAGFVRDKEGLHLICNAFGSVNEDIPAPAAQAPAKKKYIPGNMAAYMNPSNLVKTIIEGAEFKGMPGDKKPEE